MKRFSIFISGVQKELQAERVAVRDYLAHDALLSRYFDAFFFEDRPATDRRAEGVYHRKIKGMIMSDLRS